MLGLDDGEAMPKIKKMRNNILFILFTIVLLSSSCVQYRDVLSYEETPVFPETAQAITNYQPIVIQENDILQITVSSLALEAAAPFNSSNESGYMVDVSGNITLPTLGDIQVKNLTLEEIKAKLKEALQPYFSETPIVNVRLQNFKVSVNGEVGSPGIFAVANGRITMIEAITRSGDFTPYSRRDSILIIREFNNERSFGYIDFNSAAAFDSPYFYLKQNDVVYVRPNKTKVATVRDPATRILPFISIVTGLTALVLTILR